MEKQARMINNYSGAFETKRVTRGHILFQNFLPFQNYAYFIASIHGIIKDIKASTKKN